MEDLLDNYRERGLKSVALRYFNPSGCESQYRVGENHDPESHLIPLLIRSALDGTTAQIFGDDYATRDGTCVRDYIHVSDLAEAYILSMEYLTKLPDHGYYEAFNLGSGNGATVKEVIETLGTILGRDLSYQTYPRRPGDSHALVAETSRASEKLGFFPRETLKSILQSALEWQIRKSIPKKAVFLDRDGTINFDPNYLNDPEKFKLLPGVLKALRVFRDEGYLLYVVSNQSGVGRGKITLNQLCRIHEKLDLILTSDGTRIEEYALCLHRPDENCECRKPKPKLILDICRKYGIDLSQSMMIGDKISDVELGINAGCAENVFLLSGNTSSEDHSRYDVKTSLVFKDLFDFARFRFPEHFSHELEETHEPPPET